MRQSLAVARSLFELIQLLSFISIQGLGVLMFYCPKPKCCHARTAAPSINFSSKVPRLPSRALLWTYWLSTQVFCFLFVCFELIPKCDSTVLSTNGKAEKPSRKMINEVSLSPSLNPYHSPFLHKSIPLLCFLSLNGPTTLSSLRVLFPSNSYLGKLTLSYHQACLLIASRSRCPWKIIRK